MKIYRNSSWYIFQFYNAYRLVVIATFLVLNPLHLYGSLQNSLHIYFFFICYTTCILVFSYCTYSARFRFKFLVILSMLCDLLYLNALTFSLGQWSIVAAIFIYVSIATFSILIPGILTVFFAAIETIILITHSLFMYSMYDVNIIYYAGLQGAGLFATALTSLMLASWVKKHQLQAEKLRKETAYLTQLNDYIVHRLHSGVLLVDNELNVELINKKGAKQFNLAKEDKPNLEEFSPQLATIIRKWMAKTENKGKTYKCMLKNPESLIHVLPGYNDGEETNRALVIVEDVSKTKRRAQELKLASLGRFTASIAHELRNPLGAISHAIQLLEESANAAKEDSRLMEIIHSNCDRMNLLIKNILHLSRRHEAKQLFFNARIFFDKFRKEAFFKEELTLNVLIEPKELKICFDTSHLQQILIILIENSVKYGGLSHVTIDIKCFVNDKGSTCLLISDNGKGVDPDSFDMIFEPFFTTSHQGVGLGLFIAKELCEANQALIKLITGDKGTTFLLVFADGDEL